MDFVKKLISAIPIRYATVLFCVVLLLGSLVLYSVYSYRKKKDSTFTSIICVAIVIIEALFFTCADLPALQCDPVQVRAVVSEDARNAEGSVQLKSISINSESIPFPEVESGKWYWKNGMYCWDQTGEMTWGVTRSVVLLVPVGTERVFTFWADAQSGCVEITVNGHTQTLSLNSPTAGDRQVRIENSTLRKQIISAAFYVLFYLIVHAIVFLIVILLAKPLYIVALKFFRHWKYEICMLLFSLMNLIKYTRFPNYYEYSNTFYFNSYEFGFIKRGLLGEILTNIEPYLTVKDLLYWKLFFSVIVYAFISVLAGHEIRKQNDEKIRWFLVLVVCALPSSYELIYDDLRFDVYIFFLLLICVVLIAKERMIWLIPILSVCIILIGEVSCVYMMPFLLAALLYQYARKKEKRYLFSMIATAASTFALMCLFLFLDDPRAAYGSGTIIQHLQNHFEGQIHSGAISAEMSGLSAILADGNRKMALYSRKFALFLLSLIPAFLMLWVIWKKLYAKWKEKNSPSMTQKAAFWLLPLSGLGALIVMLISYDYGRYCVFMFGEEIAGIFLLARSEGIQLKYSDLHLSDQEATGDSVWPLVICVFYLSFGVLGSGVMDTPMVNQFDKFISGFLNA